MRAAVSSSNCPPLSYYTISRAIRTRSAGGFGCIILRIEALSPPSCTRLTAMRFHAILCYSEGRNSRENAMSFRFFPWTKVSLILQGLRTFSAGFGDKKIPRGCGDLPKRAIRLENPLLGSAVPRAVRDGIACNPYRLRY